MQKIIRLFFITNFFIFLLLIFQNGTAQTGTSIESAAHRLSADEDSSRSIRIINASSLKRLPAVIRDLSATLKESMFREWAHLGKNGLGIYLYDVTCKSVEKAACVRYQVNDSIYHLKIGSFNRQATDKALAATLIHEIMHCVLLDIYSRAKREEEKAFRSIIHFGLNKNDTSNFFNNDFFALVNSGEAGQHELIYQLFYPHMVSLLERFAEIHKDAFPDRRDAGHLMWSGLQKTSVYEKLSDEEKREIGQTILEEKGIDIEEY